ncbi:MAG: hypothetical protein IKP74_03240 [Clostridia bacterium]|nr:hypothetical protein [Clostridia bacterium]
MENDARERARDGEKKSETTGSRIFRNERMRRKKTDKNGFFEVGSVKIEQLNGNRDYCGSDG